MNIESMRARSYRSIKVDETTPQEAAERLRKLELYARLRAEGCSEPTALDAVGWSRATYYRWKARHRDHGLAGLVAGSRRPRHVRARQWSRDDEREVWRIRNRHPFMGRMPIRVLLARAGRRLSDSTVGRILAKGVALGRVRPCAFCRGRVRPKQRRDFGTSWAQRWSYGDRAARLGELVQVDHMTVSRDGQTLKEFRAVCPISKVMVARVFSRATARNARRFLDAVRSDLPFPVRSIQVDGGSEFRADFEDACETLETPLKVLPPRRPQFNGVVERGNDTSRVEFWSQYAGDLTVHAVAEHLDSYLTFYNTVRPHRRLNMATPMEYVAQQAA